MNNFDALIEKETRSFGRVFIFSGLELQLTEERAKVDRENQTAQAKEQLTKAMVRAELEKEKAVLATQREAMEDINRLREALAESRELQAQLREDKTVK